MIELIHKGRPQGRWLSVEDLCRDLTSGAVVLKTGDHLVVGACGPPKSKAPATDVREWLRLIG